MSDSQAPTDVYRCEVCGWEFRPAPDVTQAAIRRVTADHLRTHTEATR